MRKFRKPDSRKGGPGRGHGGGGGNRPHGGGGGRPQPQGGFPKGRAVVGIHAVNELLKVRPHAVEHLWLRDGYSSSAELAHIAEICQRHRIRPLSQAGSVLDKITSANQGVVAFASETPEISLAEIKKLEKATLIVLDEVEDPHNLGAVMRTAWLLGAQGVLTPETRAVSLNATVSKVAQGAAEHIPVMQESGLLETLKHLKSEGFWMYGLSHKGEGSIYSMEIPDKVIWVLGSESSGIRKPIERECDQLVAIPQSDPEASFNVSVAAALALGETFRQRTAGR